MPLQIMTARDLLQHVASRATSSGGVGHVIVRNAYKPGAWHCTQRAIHFAVSQQALHSLPHCRRENGMKIAAGEHSFCTRHSTIKSNQTHDRARERNEERLDRRAEVLIYSSPEETGVALQIEMQKKIEEEREEMKEVLSREQTELVQAQQEELKRAVTSNPALRMRHSERKKLGPREITSLIRQCRTAKELNMLLRARNSSLDHIHVATSFHRLATLTKSDQAGRGKPTSHQSRGEGGSSINGAGPDLPSTDKHEAIELRRSRTMSSISSTDMREAITLLTTLALQLASDLSARAISNIWWSCATMREHPAPPLLDMLLERTFATVDDFLPQTIANTLWSMATLRIPPSPSLLRRLAARTMSTAHNFEPQVLASSLWALATMLPLGMVLPRDMVHALLVRTQHVAPLFQPQDICNTFWAIATMREDTRRPAVSAALTALMLRSKGTHVADALNPQGLANVICWRMLTYADA